MAERSASEMVVVRHACAGDKQAWPGDDAARPLDRGGMEQARALAPALAGHAVRRLLSSPTARCTQTLQPLAARLGAEVERCDALGPDGSLLPWVAGDGPALAGTVLCTHGELMLPLLVQIRAAGIPVVADRADDDEWLLSKGSAWRLTFDDHGRIVALHHEAPLPLPECGAHLTSE
jgi:phosphohistidine phosphatase SixA